MRVTYGKEIIPRKMIPLPVKYLKSASSVPGNLYEIDVKLKSRADAESAKKLASVLPKEFRKRFNAEVKYVEVTDNTARIQLEGSPFSWAAVIAFLPEIFMFAGLIIAVIAVFLLITKAPWEAAAVIIGILLMVIGYRMGEMREKAVEGVVRERRRIPVE